MSLALLILQAIVAAFKFPGALSALLRLLMDTPAEKHDELVIEIQRQRDKFKETGRPTWG